MISYQNGIRPAVFILKFIEDEKKIISSEKTVLVFKNYHSNLNKQGDKNNVMSPIGKFSIDQIQLLNLLFFQLQAYLEMHGISG